MARVKPGERRRNPLPPFTTSTLQQEAYKRLGFTAKRTMATAQQLYEGVEIGNGGPTGLITYMRTDSTNVAEVGSARGARLCGGALWRRISARGGAAVQDAPKGAQEAHEAVRPTLVDKEPKALTEYLTKDQLKLYTLIWQRFVASQMAAAIFDTMTVDIAAQSARENYLFRISGATLRFSGFLVVYEETRDEDAAPDEDAEAQSLPLLSVDDLLTLVAAAGTAFHPAAPALHRSQPGQGARRIWHWPPVDLCADHLNHPAARLRRARRQAAGADRNRLCGQ